MFNVTDSIDFYCFSSGSGDSYLHRYSQSTSQWSSVGKYLQGANNNAYINGINSVGNRLFVSWILRETPDPVTNHDFYFAYSDDDGQTWKNSAGSTVSKPITPSTSGSKIYTIGQNSEIVNQEGQIVDSKGRFHALMRDKTSGANLYYHYMRTTSGNSCPPLSFYNDILLINTFILGVWSKRAINPSGLSPPLLLGKRGKLAVDASGSNLIALLPDDPKLQVNIYASTEGGSFQDWKLLTTIPNTATEPLFDSTRLEKFGVLSVFVRQAGGYPTRKVQVWDFTLGN